MEYDVVMKSSLDILVKSVNAMMDDGWKPLGGIGMDRMTGLDISYFQAVTRDDQELSFRDLPVFPKMPVQNVKPSESKDDSDAN